MSRLKRHDLQHLTPKQKKIFGLIAIGLGVVFVLLISYFIGRPMLRFVSEPEAFRAWVDGHGIWGRLLFVGMLIFQVVIAIIPGEPLEIGAGYAFGAVEGTVLCVIGTTLGGILVFLLVKSFGTRLIEVFFSVDKIRSLWFLRTTKRRNLTVFLLFAIPGTPKDLLCYFVGLTDMQLSTWILISSIARLPSIITSTIGGDAMGDQKYTLAIVAILITAAISAVGVLVYQRMIKPRRKQKQKKDKT